MDVDPRTPGKPVPASVKWVNDQMDEIVPLLEYNEEHQLRGDVSRSHQAIAYRIRRQSGDLLCKYIEMSSPEIEEEKDKWIKVGRLRRHNVDNWDQKEAENLERILYSLSVIKLCKPLDIDGSPAHATIKLRIRDEDFSKAFHTFKSLYSMHSKEWVDLDLSLVLCKIGTGKISGEFCTKVEMDPHFCRKFIIDSSNLETELERLPFVPLHPEDTLEHTELVTARAFLTTRCVTSKLAGELTVPYARGIGRIIEDCIQGKSGEPEWQGEETAAQTIPLKKPISTAGPPVRLKKLVISNFRAYHGNHELDLDSDLIVLFGANGLGKTSFFDALDFVCTGGVARFDRRFGRRRSRLTQVLKHLDSSEDDCFVQARILRGNEEILLERRMQDIANARLCGSTTDRKAVLKELSQTARETLDLGVVNLVHLFRSTHLFGQEFQSLTSDLRDKSTLRDDTVSRMLALQDYVEAIRKTQRILEELEKRVKESKLAISSLKASLESEEAEIEQLSHLARVIEQPSSVSEMGEELAKKIETISDLSVGIPKEFSREI